MTTEWTEKRVPSTEAVAFTAGKTPKSFGVKQKPHTIHDFMNNCEDISDVTGSDESFEYSVDTCFSEASHIATIPAWNDGYVSEDLSIDIKHDDKVMNEHNSLSSDDNEDMEFDDVEITSADCEYIENVTSAYCDTNKGDKTQNPAKPPVSYETISRMMDCPNLPRKAFFSRRYIPCEARFQLSDNEWNRIKPNIFQPNKLKPSWTNIMAGHMAKSNDFCTFRFKRHFVQKEGSRKRNNSFLFTASGFCIFEDCPCYFKLSMRKEHFFSKLITVEYQGSVKHATGERHSRFIQNDERKAMADKFLKGPDKTSKVYHEVKEELSSNAKALIASEGRQQSYMDKDLVRSIDILRNLLIEEESSREIPPSVVEGFVHMICFLPLIVYMWTEDQVRLWHELSGKDVSYLDAMGTIIGNHNGKRNGCSTSSSH